MVAGPKRHGRKTGGGAMAPPWLLLAGLALALICVGCGEPARPPGQGDAPPPFSLPRLADGRTVDFPQDCAGQVVALRFWASWCPHCEQEMRELEPVFRQYRDQGLVILAVNVRQQRETAAQFADSLSLSYPILLDMRGKVTAAYRVRVLPTTWIIGRDGRLRTILAGEVRPEQFVSLVEPLLSEPAQAQ